MRTRYSFLLCVFLFFLLAVSFAHADGVSVEEIPGNSVFPVEQNDISMIKEVVTVDEEVKAVFTFENTTSKSISLKMGFPFAYDKNPNLNQNSMIFRVLIAGKEIPVSKKKAAQNIKLKIGAEYNSIFTWEVSFAPFEKKVIECIYSAEWACEPQPHPSCTHFTYVTKTGALWKGKIHQADFFINLPSGYGKDITKNKLVIKTTPEAYKISGDVIEWHFKEWKPSDDISITILRSPSYPLEDFELVALMMNIMDFMKYEGDKRYYTLEDLRRHDHDEQLARFYVKVLRNEIYAHHGKIFTKEVLNRVFGSRDWYTPNPAYADSMLNDIEKKNIHFIREYEKQKGWQ